LEPGFLIAVTGREAIKSTGPNRRRADGIRSDPNCLRIFLKKNWTNGDKGLDS
jgi:hypothetical protein